MRLVLFLINLVRLVVGFNIDIPSALTYKGPEGSFFGFSVDVHRDQGFNWLLVGAPKAQTSQPGVNRGGAVYRCSTESTDDCAQIMFDRSGNNVASSQQIDQKSDQWFGATVRSSGPNGVVVACAPRYVWFSTNFKRQEPIGTCFLARNSFREFSEYSPCRTVNWGWHKQGYCQAGFSAAVAPNGQRLFIGAPGSWYWQGQTYAINTTFSAVRSPTFRTFVTGQLLSQNLSSRSDVLSTGEGSAAEDDSYLGYSMAVGNFDGDNLTDVAVAMPRGANLTGKVLLFNSNMKNLHNITGQQIGAAFGYSLTVADLDGDSLDDIIIGAPMFARTDGLYETGRVYVVYQNQRHMFRRWDILEGENSRARFGHSLAALGDINRDGFNDLAVGAPYDGPNLNGAVYIFHGSSRGVKSKAAQVILGSDVGSPLTTFGFSLAGGLDLDGNEYPDILVGSYESDAVVYLRSRPVVQLTIVNFTFEAESKQIDLEKKTCNLADGTPVSCVPLTLCLNYSGHGVTENLQVEVQFFLDSKKPKSPRLHFVSDEGKSSLSQVVILQRRKIMCRTHFVYVKPVIRDKLTPIEAEIKYFLHNNDTEPRERTKRSLEPILGLDSSTTKSDTLNVQKNCGPDNVCVPDLQVAAKLNMQAFVLGSTSRLELEVSVLNKGEDAFEAAFYLKLPTGVNFVNTERLDTASDISVQCSPPSEENGHYLRCELGNPLPAQRTAPLKILLQPNVQMNSKDKLSLDFTMEANSTNPESDDTAADNRRSISIPVTVETDLVILGVSDPDILRFNLSSYADKDKAEVGPLVTHVYEVANRGPSEVLAAEVYILWPSKTLEGEELLQLVETNIDGVASCEISPNASIYQHNQSSKEARSLKTNEVLPNTEENLRSELICGLTQCTIYRCRVGPLARSDRVVFKLRARLRAETIHHLDVKDTKLSSKLIARITTLPLDFDQRHLAIKTETISSHLDVLSLTLEAKSIAWWIILLSIGAGIVLLLVLIFALWKLGFFNRKRPEDVMDPKDDTQPGSSHTSP